MATLKRVIDCVLFSKDYETYNYWVIIEEKDTLTLEECRNKGFEFPKISENLGDGCYLIDTEYKIYPGTILLI